MLVRDSVSFPGIAHRFSSLRVPNDATFLFRGSHHCRAHSLVQNYIRVSLGIYLGKWKCEISSSKNRVRIYNLNEKNYSAA